MTDIAKEAGVATGTAYVHYESKDELWKRCLERLLAELDRAITEAVGEQSGPRAVAEAIVRGIVRVASRRPELNRIMIHEATSPGARVDWLVDTHLAG